MKTVNIGELKNQLSGYLQYVKNGEEIVKNGEEIVIRDRSVPWLGSCHSVTAQDGIRKSSLSLQER